MLSITRVCFWCMLEENTKIVNDNIELQIEK